MNRLSTFLACMLGSLFVAVGCGFVVLFFVPSCRAIEDGLSGSISAKQDDSLRQKTGHLEQHYLKKR